MHVVKHHSDPSLHFSITKISAIEIYFFDDAYSFDSSVFIGLYLISINLCLYTFLGFNCCLLWSVPLFLQISKEFFFLPVQHLIVHWTIPPSITSTCVLLVPLLSIGHCLSCSASITCTLSRPQLSFPLFIGLYLLC